MKWFKSLFSNKPKTALVICKSAPWTPESAKALSEFFKGELGQTFISALNLYISIEQARACMPGTAHPIERVSQAHGAQKLSQYILHLANVAPEPQSNELTDEELDNIVNEMVDRGSEEELV